MTRREIPFEQFRVRSYNLWDKQWMLLMCGDYATGHFNTMTVGWGSLGTMWGRPFVQVVVRPSRYTHEFMEQYDTFTLSAFPKEYRDAMLLLGTRSGRGGDKIAESGLTPIASAHVAAPGFAEAELILECRKIYWADMDAAHFLDPSIEGNYPHGDYHRIYFGQIVAIYGSSAYGE
jgi:flavin reductase (DIM6/NTAB) family NADH-FMN oxidoreductase RutF